MSTATLSLPASVVPPSPLHRFSVDEYHRMIASGVLTEDDPVELLEGWIVEKMARNPPHDGMLPILNAVLEERLPVGWHLRVQSAITTIDSEPEPDIAVVRGSMRAFLRRHPDPTDIGLVIEVADTSLDRDRGIKARLYARAGIAVYWIINLADRQIEEFTSHKGDRYSQRAVYTPRRSIPLIIDGHEVSRIPVRSLLP